MFQKFITWVSQALSDDSGSPSSLRPVFWLMELVVALGFVALISYAIFSHYKYPTTPFNPAPAGGLLLGLFTANRGSKQLQKVTEGSDASSSPPQQ